MSRKKRSVYDCVKLQQEDSPYLYELSDDVTQGEKDSIVNAMCHVYSGLEKCVGLAAPQVGINKKVVLLRNYDNTLTVYFNLRMLYKSLVKKKSAELCMSVDGRYEVRRSLWVIYEYEDSDGKVYTKFAFGVKARRLQHEYDHLRGICINFIGRKLD